MFSGLTGEYGGTYSPPRRYLPAYPHSSAGQPVGSNAARPCRAVRGCVSFRRAFRPPWPAVLLAVPFRFAGNYGPPQSFNFDRDSSDEPIETNTNLRTCNAQTRVDDFVLVAESLANATRGSEIMFTMGSDFNYEAAETWYENCMVHR